jgi:hypothetical protein
LRVRACRIKRASQNPVSISACWDERRCAPPNSFRACTMQGFSQAS